MIKIIDKVNTFVEYFAGILLGIITISIFIQVLVRITYASIPVSWTSELARYLMFWVVFLGGAVAVRKSRMIAMKAILPVVSGKLKQIITVFSHLVSLIFYGFIFVIGLEWAMTSGLARSSSVMYVPMVFVYSAMFVGAGFMILNTLTLLIESFLHKKEIT
ncbi:TRAP transporter small permease subunit [Salicibibacter cibarius]|uniref:TRAP transporter small permease subunit n=1 Tax=Salicibibacter cibarius TaxID=2743000 RepID=A0A7T7CDA6_9BACI|nr:TRAP transporter small permease subunit [Salicibibacter cibarius]QQK77780.1 TRAP transporter small permease subunit [Salicibibacter cibarius]